MSSSFLYKISCFFLQSSSSIIMFAVIDLESYKMKIIFTYSDSDLSTVKKSLKDNHDLNVSIHTIIINLWRWDVWKLNYSVSQRDSALNDQIKTLFYLMKLKNKDMLQILCTESYTMSSHDLRCIQKNLNLVQRQNDADKQEQKKKIV